MKLSGTASSDVDQPRVGQQPPGQRQRGLRPADEVGERARAVGGRGGAGRRDGGRPGGWRATSARPPSRLARSSSADAGRAVVDQRRRQARAERGGQRELAAGLDLEVVAQRPGGAGGAGLARV